MCPRPHPPLCACKTTYLAPELQVSMGPSPHRRFLHAKQRLLDQNYKSLWVPALICGFFRQNNDFGSEMQVSIGPRSHLSFYACKTAYLAPEFLVSMDVRTHLSFCACKTACLAPELLVLTGPSPLLLFLNAKQQLLDQIYKSPWVPDFPC